MKAFTNGLGRMLLFAIAAPAVLAFWFATASANFYTGLSYGTSDVFLALDTAWFPIALSTALVFGVVSLSADVLGSASTFAARNFYRQRAWLPFAAASLIGAFCIAWTFHSAHRFISLSLTQSQSEIADQNNMSDFKTGLIRDSMTAELANAQKQYDQAGWATIPAGSGVKATSKREARTAYIGESKTRLDAARDALSAYKEPAKHKADVSPFSGLELAFAIFMTLVSAFGPYVFFSGTPASKPQDRNAIGKDIELVDESEIVSRLEHDAIVADLKSSIAALEACVFSSLYAGNDAAVLAPVARAVGHDTEAAVSPCRIDTSFDSLDLSEFPNVISFASHRADISEPEPIVFGALDTRYEPDAQPAGNVKSQMSPNEAIQRFLADFTEPADGDSVQATILYDAYRLWAAQNEGPCIVQWKFGKIVTQTSGYGKKVDRLATRYIGLRLNQNAKAARRVRAPVAMAA